ncbi:Aste57867_11278 [Aphanomyces stellatus]|uniref:Aste57867_11278 protein n=1 Tax=Aphanomyces stellatus TaxID=120398 RepID=A0A485KSM6_9STRA|nr:hypothetical protein As57867_011236 [Aphanomyces stellatus]VFT88140.1 Aste57867_11278 [Aphanomyces stellatus]
MNQSPSPKFEQMSSTPLGPIASAIRVQAETSDHADDNAPTCYMCMESTHGCFDTPLELIAPCACQSFVHRKCLDHWRVTSYTYQAMTRCPTCHQDYTFDTVQVYNDEKLQHAIWKEQLWRWGLVLGVILLGSMVIWLIDRGTPKFLQLHWNGLDGKIYNGIGLTKVPRFVVYLVLSLLMAAFITGLVTICSWCCRSNPNGSYVCLDCTYPGCYCGDCGDCGGCGGCGDCGGCGEFAAIVGVVVLVCIVFVGIAMMLTAIVGGFGSAIDRRGEKRIRGLQVQRQRIRNLRPIGNVV